MGSQYKVYIEQRDPRKPARPTRWQKASGPARPIQRVCSLKYFFSTKMYIPVAEVYGETHKTPPRSALPVTISKKWQSRDSRRPNGAERLHWQSYYTSRLVTEVIFQWRFYNSVSLRFYIDELFHFLGLLNPFISVSRVVNQTFQVEFLKQNQKLTHICECFGAVTTKTNWGQKNETAILDNI